MNFLALFDKCIVLRDTAQSQFVHEVDFVWFRQEFVFERLDNHGERCGKQHDLPLWRTKANQLLNDWLELGGQEFVCFVHDKSGALREIGDAFAGEVEHAAGGSDDDMHGLAQAQNVVLETSAARGDHYLDVHVLAQGLAHLGRLQRELSSGHQDECLDVRFLTIDLLEGGDHKSRCFAGAVLCARQDVAACQSNGDGFLLDGTGSLKAGFKDAHEQVSLEKVVFKLVSFGSGDVLGLRARVSRGERQLLFPVSVLVVLLVLVEVLVVVLVVVLVAVHLRSGKKTPSNEQARLQAAAAQGTARQVPPAESRHPVQPGRPQQGSTLEVGPPLAQQTQ